MTTATAEKIEISTDVRELADKIKPHIKISTEENDPSRGLAILDKNFYVANLPEGITKDSIKALQDHDSLVVAAGSLALGEVGIDFMKKHADIKNIGLRIDTVGKNNIEFGMQRHRAYPIPGKKDETADKYGGINAVYNSYSTRPVGEFAKVKETISQLAAAALAKK